MTVIENGNKSKSLRHIIGRVATVFTNTLWMLPPFNTFRTTTDATIPDYEFWDKFRHAMQDGYEIVGLFGQGIIDIITPWVIGRSFRIELAEVDDKRQQQKVIYTNKLLQRFCLSNQQLLLDMYEDLLGLGDQFVFVNPDASLSIPSPDTVEILYDELDYRKPVGYVIYTNTDKARIKDEYHEDRRVVRILRNGANTEQVITFPNLIGRLPVVHFANDRKTNEQRGRPLYQSMLPLLKRYEDTLARGIEGAQVAGNPLPVLENLANPDEALLANKVATDEEYIEDDGSVQTRQLIKFDRNTVLLLGEGGRFKFAAPPPGFSRDITNILKLLFLIMLDRTHIPEFMWGGAIAGGSGSVEAQMPPWVRFIEGRRVKLAGVPADQDLGMKPQGGLHELADIWLRIQALTDSKIFIGPTVLRWADLTEGDERLTFEWVKYLHSRRAITTATALRASGLVDNIDSELEAALAEAMFEVGEFDDFAGDLETPLTEDGSPDLRGGSGASAPRMPAFSGGRGRNQPGSSST